MKEESEIKDIYYGMGKVLFVGEGRVAVGKGAGLGDEDLGCVDLFGFGLGLS